MEGLTHVESSVTVQCLSKILRLAVFLALHFVHTQVTPPTPHSVSWYLSADTTPLELALRYC